MDKKIRLGDLVRNSGRPQAVTLWSDPKEDRTFSKAVKENRVVTVIQDPTSKRKPSGEIGFHERQHAFYLVFPRPLSNEKDSRVIGINYSLLEEPVENDRPQKAKLPQKPRQEKAEPIQQNFRLRIRRTAMVETDIDVRAKDQAEAEHLAMNLVRQQAFPLKKAAITEEIVRNE